MRAEIGVLTSNVVIEGDMTKSINYTEPWYDPQFTGYGGHTIYIDNSTVRIEGAEFRYMGQGGRMGRYPVHWHHRKDAPGQYIKRSSVHDTFHRTVTVHDSNYVVVDSVVAYKCYGHSIYLEDGTEIGNQFFNNLVVTSIAIGTDDENQNESGFLLDARCSDHAPGLRAQYVDYTPSGFWITNANNTFVGNAAVGHTYGFWIRVDLMFEEPGYPCTTCTCATTREDWPARYVAGLVMVDNSAHACSIAGLWIKENWYPRIDDNYFSLYGDVDQFVDGLVLWKNMIGFELYGISTVHFRKCIGADNLQGVMFDWQRKYSNNFTELLLVGETENFGNPDIATNSAPCSAYFGNIPVSKAQNRYVQNVGFRASDQRAYLDDVTIINYMQSPCYEDSFGFYRYPFKYFNTYPADTWMNNLKLVNTTFIMQASGQFNPGDQMYQGGYQDLDGSFPCVDPGSWLFYNTPDVVTKNCEFRSNWNMFVCPPLPQGVSYRQISIVDKDRYIYFYSTTSVNATWECGQKLSSTPYLTVWRTFNVRTDKVYHFQWDQGYTPKGIHVKPNIDLHTGVEFEGMDIIFTYPGKWSFQYYTYSNDSSVYTETPGGVTSWIACNTTYVKFHLTGPEGNQLLATYNANLADSSATCGNPWPIPAPTGYTCGDSRVVTSNKNTDTCSSKPLQNTPRTWVTRPKLIQYDLNGNIVQGDSTTGATTGAQNSQIDLSTASTLQVTVVAMASILLALLL